MKRPGRRYTKDFQLFDIAGSELAAENSAGKKSWPGIIRPDGALQSPLQNQDALVFIKAAEIHTKDKTKEKRWAAQLKHLDFYPFDAALLDVCRPLREKTLTASKLTLESFWSAQGPRVNTFLVPVRTVLRGTMSLLFHGEEEHKLLARKTYHTI